MKTLIFKNEQDFLNKSIDLPTSKSESNRALIIQALSKENILLQALSKAEDTQIMKNLLQSTSHILNVGAAGTVMRFLTAYCVVKADKTYILQGSERMHQRPIEELVAALNSLGAHIEYLENQGFPPLKIKPSQINKHKVSIRGDISSQYISALMLIAPLLEKGLEIQLNTPLTSALYCQMTQQMMQHFKAQVSINEHTICIAPMPYKAAAWRVESDWSAASYWFMFMALYNKNCKLYLKGLKADSLQPDSICTVIFQHFGVKSSFDEQGLILEKIDNFKLPNIFEYDCSNCPDIAQTIACTCAALGIECHLSGLKTLKIKETDRIVALANELAKFNIKTLATNNSLSILKGNMVATHLPIHTYKDHRMAMAFAPLVLKVKKLIIEDEMVVSKSYPNFWQELEALL